MINSNIQRQSACPDSNCIMPGVSHVCLVLICLSGLPRSSAGVASLPDYTDCL
jgi:hypothetical protein